VIWERFLPDALAEYEEAAAYYNARVSADEVEHALDRIIENPGIGAPIFHSLRRILVHRFPYGIIYREEAAGPLIVAVAHLSREPSYWRNRV
jgi:toxin ParE1/3/4